MGRRQNKLEFFIGATKQDLNEARKKIIDSILESGHIPSGMELWSSGVSPLHEDVEKHLEECDVHIIISGARYGQYIDERSQLSFTEWEYNKSMDDSRPIIAFIIDENDFMTEREKVVLTDENESKNNEKLIGFRHKLQKERFCRSFKNTPEGIAELGRHCANAIHELMNYKIMSQDRGWIRADSIEGNRLRRIRENEILQRQIDRMGEFSLVGNRIELDQISKQTMSQVFWDDMIGRIRRHGYNNLFFESGSTLVYVSDQFERMVLKNSMNVNSWNVRTNNVITLLQLLLNSDLDVRRFPATVPDPKDKYGAIFPREWLDKKEAPPQEPRSLYQWEKIAVDKIRKEFQSFAKKILFLATTSCWDLNHNEIHFRGPHVGSHPNMLFKRALFTTGQPVVIFLNAEKLGDPFQLGKCFPVFGPDVSLDNALKEYPLAVCIGFDQKLVGQSRATIDKTTRTQRNNPRIILDTIDRLGFVVPYNSFDDGEGGAIIMGNQKFKEMLPND